MAERWLTVAEAAAAMRVHPRTVERRVAANKIESRRGDQSQLEVLVDLPEPVESVPSEAFETVRELADRQVDIAAGSASALIRVAREQSMRAENQLAIARRDAGRYRREAQMAMGLVGLVLLMAILAVGWCTQSITAARGQRQLSDLAAEHALKEFARAQTELETARQALSVEQQHAARADQIAAAARGELSAYKVELSAYNKTLNDVTTGDRTSPSTTRPASLLRQFSEAFIGQ